MPPVKRKKIHRRRHFLREWRQFREMSLEAASERMEINHGTLSRIENNKSPYNQDFLERAALAYGCDPSDLLVINPMAADASTEAVIMELRRTTPDKRKQALAVINALLKAS